MVTTHPTLARLDALAGIAGGNDDSTVVTIGRTADGDDLVLITVDSVREFVVVALDVEAGAIMGAMRGTFERDHNGCAHAYFAHQPGNDARRVACWAGPYWSGQMVAPDYLEWLLRAQGALDSVWS